MYPSEYRISNSHILCFLFKTITLVTEIVLFLEISVFSFFLCFESFIFVCFYFEMKYYFKYITCISTIFFAYNFSVLTDNLSLTFTGQHTHWDKIYFNHIVNSIYKCMRVYWRVKHTVQVVKMHCQQSNVSPSNWNAIPWDST